MGSVPRTPIETHNNMEELVSLLTKLAQKEDYLFRGYSLQKHLYPSIIRDGDFRDIENNFLYKFEKYGSQYIQAISPIDMMSQAQHFGLPTRLLDFTYNPFVATYFSLFTPKSNNANGDDSTFYYIRYASIQENILLNELPSPMAWGMLNGSSSSSISERLKTSIEKVEKDNERENRIVFLDPNQSNQRMVMQQGLFMFPYTLEKDKHIEIIQNNTRLIRIHKSVRGDMQRYLNTIGINAYRLMPDLSSLCEAVSREVKDDRANRSSLFKRKKSGNEGDAP